MLNRPFINVLLLLMLCAPAAAQAQNLENTFFITEHLPPYTASVNGEAQGLSVDILRATLRAAGINPRNIKIHVYPWARGFKMTLKTPNTCLFATVRNKEREHLFKWAGPIGDVNFALISLKDNIEMNSFADIQKYSVGVIRSGVSHQTLLQKAPEGTRIELSTDITAMIKKLQKGRIDLILENEHVLHHVIKKSNLDWDKFKINYVLNFGRMYFAFSNSTEDYVVRRMQKGIDTIRRNGKLKEIQQKFLPKARATSLEVTPLN
ncbi:ABC transporter substrate-binding protein [Desulfovibrio sp. JC010]|uniref:substrate-binding periplasmic protein n=1 Tax=Desulfovibrio sp. JC010 TaxID=2593641 RepID=UPI0013D5F43C|nr:transporter substrate-binding domain-containing protein [Desulfovibrio sp. JC010]NDV26854.1 transporter substrate-binding domain-containing protein [Desulfovibrio sp. JC010]